jgi:solute carrier family 25 iron transporter 28/37
MLVENENTGLSRVQCARTQSRGRFQNAPPSCSVAKQIAENAKKHHLRHPEPKLRHQYKGLVDALVQIKAHEGYAGFFRGVYPRLLVHAPSVAVSWTTFEVLKKTLDTWAEEE